MIQLNRNGVVISDNEQIVLLNRLFAEHHCVVLHHFLDTSLVQSITKQLESATFYSNSHKDNSQSEFATDLTVCENEIALHQIHLLLNNQKLFSVVKQITGCETIGSFGGRIYRNEPETENQLEWHDDTEENQRLIGISINLSVDKYRGGVFQLRERKSKTIVCEVACGNSGDAHIFRISPELQHRVTKVEGDNPRTAAAGWFNSRPDINTAINSLFKKSDFIN